MVDSRTAINNGGIGDIHPGATLNTPKYHSTPSRHIETRLKRFHLQNVQPDHTKRLIAKYTRGKGGTKIIRHICSLEDPSFPSTGESTLSLLSPIYHDSYESLSDITLSSGSGDDDDKVKGNNEIRDTDRKGEPSTSPHHTKSLSPWEQWVIQKNVERRQKDLELKQNEIVELRNAKMKELEKKHKEALAKQRRKEWLLEKSAEEARMARIKSHREHLEKTKQQQKREDLNRKSLTKVNQWLTEKAEQERVTKEDESRVALDNRIQERERRIKAQQRWLDWCKRAKISRTSSSYGYTGGRITDYYNWCSYPKPSFTNPQPWQPLDINSKSHKLPDDPSVNPLSPPLLWVDVLKRESAVKGKTRAQNRSKSR